MKAFYSAPFINQQFLQDYKKYVTHVLDSISPQILPSPQESLDINVHRRRSISPAELAPREPVRRLSSREETSDHETEFPIKYAV